MYLNKKIIALLLLLSCNLCNAKTLDNVLARAKLVCGVSQNLPGFATVDAKGVWSGLEVDICRAVALAIFNDQSKVSLVALDTKERFTALQAGEIDLLARNDTWTMTRNTALGLEFTAIMLYDQQGFMVTKAANIQNIDNFTSGVVCVENTSNAQDRAKEFFSSRPQVILTSFDTVGDMLNAYNAQECNILSANQSLLAGYRSRFSDAANHLILPNLFTKDPFAPAVRQGDTQWANLVRWIIYGLINAEELGITKANVESFATSKDPSIRQFLGYHGNLYESLQLKNTLMRNIIVQLGNYGEIFENNLGSNSKLKLNRLHNRLWTDGGLMYAPVFR